jgi:hypothetical protein
MDRRQYSASSQRNREPIAEALMPHLPPVGTILEVASGSGEHAVHFAPLLPQYCWQTTNYEEDQIESVIDWITQSPSPNLRMPLRLDTTDTLWPVETGDYSDLPITGIFNANMIHISPFEVCEGLLAGAGRILTAGGRLFIYGPFKVGGTQTAPTNETFDHWLKSRNPAYAIRDQEVVIDLASENGLTHLEVVQMPANNLLQVFEKQ